MGVSTLRGAAMANGNPFICIMHYFFPMPWVYNPFHDDTIAIAIATPLSVNVPIYLH